MPPHLDQIKEKFSVKLLEALKKHYGKIPSASIFANDFNLRSRQTKPISNETARRWMRGESLPDLNKLAVILSYLDLDLSFMWPKNQSKKH